LLGIKKRTVRHNEEQDTTELNHSLCCIHGL
jgi:hypothetical protein